MSRKIVPARPRSSKKIEATAMTIIRELQPGVLTNGEQFDIERFFDCHLEDITGVATDYQHLDNGIFGYTDSEEMVCVISRDLAEDRFQNNFCRSTTAHECGHAILNVKDYRVMRAVLRSIHGKDHQVRMYREQDIVVYRNPEWQAWRFAGAILMPESTFVRAVNGGAGEKELSKMFGVNPAFVRTRARALKLVLRK